MCFAPVSSYFQEDMDAILHVDASDIAIGAVIAQEHSDSLRPMNFALTNLSNSESCLFAAEKECLAILSTMERYRHFILR